MLDAGEWDPSQPIVFGGESLEAAMREAAHDPKRRDQLAASLANAGYDPSATIEPEPEKSDKPRRSSFSSAESRKRRRVRLRLACSSC